MEWTVKDIIEEINKKFKKEITTDVLEDLEIGSGKDLIQAPNALLAQIPPPTTEKAKQSWIKELQLRSLPCSYVF